MKMNPSVNIPVEERYSIKIISNYTLPVLLVLAIFSKELFTWTVGGIMVDFYGYLFLGFVFVILLSVLRINLYVLILYLWLIFSSLFIIYFHKISLFPFLKQAIPISFIYLGTYHILSSYRYSITAIFTMYVKISFYTAVFGIIQYFLHKVGISIIIGFTGKLDSIAYEPSHYAAIIMPAVVYTTFQYKKYKMEVVVFLLALAFTESLTSLAIFLIALVIPWLKLLYIPFISLFFWGMYHVIPMLHEDFEKRIEGTLAVFSKNDYTTETTTAGTVASFASNFDVALYTAKKFPLTGSGLGGHETMYERRFKGTLFENDWFYGLNQKSAHSLSIRILSEMGFLGLGLYIFFLFKMYIKRKETLIFHIISLSCISHFLCKTLKLGGYIDYGTPFFFCMLILNLSLYKEFRKTNRLIQ